jgi:hypothetical protein
MTSTKVLVYALGLIGGLLLATIVQFLMHAMRH